MYYNEIKSFFVAFKVPAPPTGFHVALSHPQSLHSTVAFDSIISHYGNCWNSNSKMFEAPVTGLYSFHVTIMNHNTQLTAWAEILHGNKIVQRVHSDQAHGPASYDTGSASALIRVMKGENVSVILRYGRLYSDKRDWIHFVGFLVQTA